MNKTIKDFFSDVISVNGSKRYDEDMENALDRLQAYAAARKEETSAVLNRLLDAEEERMKKNREKNERRLAEQIEKCRAAYNGYYACEPDKNAVYRKEFHSEGGIFDCMNKYHEVVKQLLPLADTLENMQMIIWGNALQYLKFALDKLEKKSAIPMKELKTTEACEKYLAEEKRIPLKIKSLQKIEEVINAFNREREIECTERERRLKYEKIQQELTRGTAAEYIRQLKEGGYFSEEDMQVAVCSYREKAYALDNIFKKILSEMNQLQDEEENQK